MGNGGTEPGTRIQQWTCLPFAQWNQLWRIEVIELPSLYEFGGENRVKGGGHRLRAQHHLAMCLGRAPDLAELHPCDIVYWWMLYPVDLSPEVATFTIGSGIGSGCLEVPGSGLADGIQAEYAHCQGSGQLNQVWRLRRVGP